MRGYLAVNLATQGRPGASPFGGMMAERVPKRRVMLGYRFCRMQYFWGLIARD